jgi:hypothetical protein
MIGGSSSHQVLISSNSNFQIFVGEHMRDYNFAADTGKVIGNAQGPHVACGTQDLARQAFTLRRNPAR